MSDLLVVALLVLTNVILMEGAYTRGDQYQRAIGALMTLLYLYFAIASLARGNLVISCGDGAIVALWLRWLWKRRPPRKRRPARVAGVVKDLGHRLIVSAEGT